MNLSIVIISVKMTYIYYLHVLDILETKKKFVGIKIIPTISFEELQDIKNQLSKVKGFDFLIRAVIRVN